MTIEEASGGASIRMRRRVAWNETDAAGHNHFTAVFRWIEEAEHSLFRSMSAETAMIARIPRVHIDVDYHDRLYFGEVIDVHVGITRVGNSSCAFEFVVCKADGVRAISGNYVIVHASGTASGAEPWPAQLRSALASGGVVEFDISGS